MQACVPVEFPTPKKIRLLGLWFGPERTRTIIIFVHGLGGSVFSMRDLVGHLTDRHTAVLVFNNRGAEIISKVRRVDARRPLRGGMAHEVFTDCADDIEGAVRFAKRRGAKHIFLAGHSTGCQKSAYWAFKKGRGVRGIILLAPISDYSSTLKQKGTAALARAKRVARTLVRKGKAHVLLPTDVWGSPIDAQRYLSLFGGASAEEVFPYAQTHVRPRALRAIRKPLLVLLAEKDEYGDRPARNIAAWFDAHNRSRLYRSAVIPKVAHGFTGAEARVTKLIKIFIKKAVR